MVKTPTMASMKKRDERCFDRFSNVKGSCTQVSNLFEWTDISMIEIHEKNTKNQPLAQVFRLKKYVKEHFF